MSSRKINYCAECEKSLYIKRWGTRVHRNTVPAAKDIILMIQRL